MFRLLSKLSSYHFRSQQLPKEIVKEVKRFPVFSLRKFSYKQFVKETNPLPVPLLRELSYKNTPRKWTSKEYIKGDPHCIDVLGRDEINEHRVRAMNNLSTDNWRVRGSAHVMIVAGAEGSPGYQRSEFVYLCDCLLPNMMLIIIRNCKLDLLTMLCEPYRENELDPELAKIACKRYNVDEIVTLPQVTQMLHKMANTKNIKLWFTLDKSRISKYIWDLADQLQLPIDCPLKALRLAMSVKSPKEVIAIKRAHSIAAQSMQEVISNHELKIDKPKICGMFLNKCRERYAHQPGPYEPRFTDVQGRMCLMDGACQYGGYCGQLARSWSNYGRFTPPQKAIYNLLLELRCILCKIIYKGESDELTPRNLQEAYLELLAQHLQWQGVVRKTTPMDASWARQLTCLPPQVNHIGLDLDTKKQLLDTPLKPNNVVSMQLSIGIPANCQLVYPEFRGVMCILGDSIYIKENHELEFLTVNCSFSGRELEEMRSRRPRLLRETKRAIRFN